MRRQIFPTSARRRRHPPSSDLKVPGNRARRHVGIVTVQPDYSLEGVLRASLVAFNLIGVLAELKSS